MTPLPTDVSDSELLEFVDRWVALLELEDYEAARVFTDQHVGSGNWTADAIREAIKRHGERVTLEGDPADLPAQVKEVTRWPTKPDGTCGDIWYDLFVDGRDTDLTALFYLRPVDGGLTLQLVDIGVR